MSSESWPPQLKEWVAKCLGQITDSNRAEVQAELKEVISDAFAAHTLWTTDWAGVQLKSLLPKAPPVFNNLKRKKFASSPSIPYSANSVSSLDTGLATSKKTKKAAANKNAAASGYSHPTDFNDQAALKRRAERFQREHELEKTKHLRTETSLGFRPPAVNRSLGSSRSGSAVGGAEEPEGDPNVIDWDRYTIVGTSQELFKDYLRLTSEPKPETIRPYAVLQKTLVALKQRWKEKASYAWVCNQFKSLRQDLTVQRIKNEFTVQVYEIHARIALETHDWAEYPQCQSTLKSLYELGIPGRVEEFTAYRILFLLLQRNHRELNTYVGQLTPRQRADPGVKHALEVHRVLATGNYHKLCELFFDAPYMGAYLMDEFMARERLKALMVISRAYKTIGIAFLQQTLSFDAIDEIKTFLVDHQITTFINPNSTDSELVLDCKTAIPAIASAYDTESKKKIGAAAV